LSLAFTLLKWSPQQVWAATLPELELAFATWKERPGQALSRRGLETLMVEFPDEQGAGG